MSNPKSATEWLDDIADPDEGLGEAARLKLGSLGAADSWMAPQLLAALDAPDEDRRFWSLTALSCLARNNGLGVEAAPRLISVAQTDPAFGNRQAALMALARCPQRADIIVPAIIAIVRTDREAFVRAEGIRALSALGPAASSAAEFLVSTLDDDDASVAKYAAVALKFVPVSEPAHVQAVVIASRTHRNPQVRSQLEAAVEMQRYA